MYYPKNKIGLSKYTSGMEFKVKKTGINYIGFYYETYDHKFFSGNGQFDAASVELETVSNIKNNSVSNTVAVEYNIAKNIKDIISSNVPNHFYPKPSLDDYSKGFITRYFIKRVNSGNNTIKEISKQDFISIQKNILYISTSFDWKIAGDNVIEYNKKVVKEQEKTLPGISIYLTNLLELSKIIL